MIGVEGGGRRHQTRSACGPVPEGWLARRLQGTRTFVLQDDDGQIMLTHSSVPD